MYVCFIGISRPTYIYFFYFWLHNMACGILVSQPGIEPTTPVLERVLTTEPSGKAQVFFFFLTWVYLAVLDLNRSSWAFRCSTEAPEHGSSVVALHSLSCSTPFEILVPWPASPALEGRFLTTREVTGTVVPSLFGKRDWFHGRQFSHRLREKKRG